MSIFSNIISGGQTNLHSIRMGLQVFYNALKFSLFIGLLCFAYKSYHNIPKYAWGQYFEYTVADMKKSFISKEKQRKITQLYYPVHGKPYKRSIISITNDHNLKRISHIFEKLVIISFYAGVKVAGYVIGLILLLWGLKGKFSKTNKHKRGIQLISEQKLKLKLLSSKNASDLKLGNLPLVKDSETSHILVAGTTGSGKSNCFNLLLAQVRKRGDKTIIYDPTGEYISKFYRKGKDHILNPFDSRGKNWNMWAEFTHLHEIEKIAAALIPTGKSNDPFWIESARALFIYVARNYAQKKQYNAKEFVHFILNSNSSKLREELKNTPIAPMLDKENNKQLLSVKSTLMTYIRCFEYLEDIEGKDDDGFSITDWIQGSETSNPDQEESPTEPTNLEEKDDSWLFISCKPSQRELLKPLISAWLDISIAALMNLNPNQKRRCWFFIDELPSLQKLPSLRTALAESRKYGGCIVAGMQSLNQMNEIYGHEEAKAMLNMFNTEVYFRMIESHNREMISKALGDAEETHYQENISYGAHAVRDGVSTHTQTKVTRLVTASELRHLENLEAYIHLPTVEAITKIIMPYADIHSSVKAFRDKNINDTTYADQKFKIDEDKNPNQETYSEISLDNNESTITYKEEITLDDKE